MLQIQAQFVADTGTVCCSSPYAFVIVARPPPDQIPSATQSDSVRHPIRFRPPSNQIPSATRSDSVRHPIRFRPPPVGGYGILPYPRSPHRGCSGLRCTNQPTTQPTNQPNKPNKQPNNQTTNQTNKPFNFTHQKQLYIQQKH